MSYFVKLLWRSIPVVWRWNCAFYQLFDGKLLKLKWFFYALFTDQFQELCLKNNKSLKLHFSREIAPSSFPWSYGKLLPAATKLGQGNVFTGVCDSVHRGESASVHAGMPAPLPTRQTPRTRQTPPRTRQTPPRPGRHPRTRQTPPQIRQTPPRGRHQHMVNEQLVCILLECILVSIFYCSTFPKTDHSGNVTRIILESRFKMCISKHLKKNG